MEYVLCPLGFFPPAQAIVGLPLQVLRPTRTQEPEGLQSVNNSWSGEKYSDVLHHLNCTKCIQFQVVVAESPTKPLTSAFPVYVQQTHHHPR